jgi:putative thioredoxin
MRPTDLSIAGAVDLSSLRPAPTPPPSAAAAPSAPGAPVTVLDVTEATFEAEVLQRSLQVPVLIDFWADWCGPCKQLSPVLERLAAEAGGAWVLAKVDVDSNQAIAGQLQIQSIPTVLLALGGRLIQGFTGALPERELRSFLEQVMAAAAQAGLSGPVAAGGAAPAAPVADPLVVAAEDALAEGDYAGAVAAYDTLLEQRPGDAEAVAGRAWAALLLRSADLDPEATLAAAAAAPDDVAAQTVRRRRRGALRAARRRHRPAGRAGPPDRCRGPRRGAGAPARPARRAGPGRPPRGRRTAVVGQRPVLARRCRLLGFDVPTAVQAGHDRPRGQAVQQHRAPPTTSRDHARRAGPGPA